MSFPFLQTDIHTSRRRTVRHSRPVVPSRGRAGNNKRSRRFLPRRQDLSTDLRGLVDPGLDRRNTPGAPSPTRQGNKVDSADVARRSEADVSVTSGALFSAAFSDRGVPGTRNADAREPICCRVHRGGPITSHDGGWTFNSPSRPKSRPRGRPRSSVPGAAFTRRSKAARPRNFSLQKPGARRTTWPFRGAQREVRRDPSRKRPGVPSPALIRRRLARAPVRSLGFPRPRARRSPDASPHGSLNPLDQIHCTTRRPR